MLAADLLRPDPMEELCPWWAEVPPGPHPLRGPGLEESRILDFEFNSRGDRVPGRLRLPDTPGPHPVIVLQHGLGGSIDSSYMEACGPWVRGGAAVASIDFPLHGRRRSAKLSERLIGAIAAGGHDADLEPNALTLWLDFARQSVIDVRRLIDLLDAFPDTDAKRVTYAGFSLGAMLGTAICASDSRLRAAAFALGGGGFGPAELDPCAYVAAIAPRPVLLLNNRGDETVPASAAEALHAAARDPKEVVWFEGGHGELPGVALKKMWRFSAEAIGL